MRAALIGVLIALAAPASAADPAARALAVQARAQATSGIFGLHNAGPATLAHWRKGKAQVLAGVASTSICTIGDSTTAGIGPANPGRPKSYPSYLTRKFNAVGLSARSESWWGIAGQASVSAYSSYDPRVTFGTGWATGSNTLGGAIPTAGASVTTAVSFTPTSSVDTVDIYYQQGSGFGTFTVDIGGAALATVNSGSPTTAALVKLSVPLGAAGTPTINLKRNGTGGAIFIAGMVARNSAAPAIDVLNMGWGSSTTTLWNDASFPARPRAAIGVVAPALCTINLGINDRTDSYAVSIDSYRANLSAWVDTLQAQGTDVILMIPIPSAAARSPLAQQAAYNQVVRDVAAAKGVPWIDMTEVWGSYDAQNALSYYADQVHAFEAGYADEADLLFRVLQRF